jgi:hypothetical protein
MMRPFMRDFKLDKQFGFEPNALQAIISRALNPYVTILSGGFSPDGSIPKNWFDFVVGWSIFSHLSKASLMEWLQEIPTVLRPGGHAVFTSRILKMAISSGLHIRSPRTTGRRLSVKRR